jgi:rhodanese-related sulfurtransferase
MGFFSSSVPSVSATEAAQKLRDGSAVLVDVRHPEEYAGGHAHGALNCPLPSLNQCVDKLKRFTEVYVICQSGGRSAAAVSVLLSSNVRAINVSGGTSAWRSLGLPIKCL